MRGLAVLVVSLVAAVGVLLGVAAPASAAGGAWPVSGSVVRGFDPPEVAWAAGHRGVDVSARPGAAVLAPADGVVSFTGVVAGRPVVVVDHGDLRTTLEPVVAVLPVGARVARGDPVGRLEAGHSPCPAEACLHWGLKRGEDYLDPLTLLGQDLRLLPASAVAGVRERARARQDALRDQAAAPLALATSGRLQRPSAGRVTSVFGMRFHPIFHEWRMHQGVDLSAPCGTPLVAAADGVVVHRGFDASGGWRLVIDHGTVDGTPLQTVYLHAQGYGVRAGERVARGQVVGTMGSTGWSTGCHLHFGVKASGRHVDPLGWIAGG